MGVTIQESDEPDDGIELFAAGSWPNTSPLATLWGTNATLGERPDWATAARFLSRAMERHRAAAEAFAKALLTDAEIGDLNQATADLEETIVSLGIARSMLASDPGAFPVRRSEGGSSDQDAAGDDLEWHIGFAEYNEYADDILPPLFELPVSLPLGVSLLHDDDTTVRVRDARVYSDGLLVTVDVAIRRAHELTPAERMELENALEDVLGEDIDEDEEGEAHTHPALISATARATSYACVAQWEYWVARGEHIDDEFVLRNPLGNGDDFWRVGINDALIDEARSRVVDLRSGD